MNKNIKLSIIIPAYNVEQYIEKCIYSCTIQNILRTDYEIIIINDGSIDNTLCIIKQVIENLDNCIVYSQDNLGLSNARNKGLSLARGEYIWFVDSDDWIENNCLKAVCQQLNDIDILSIAYNRIYEDKILFTKYNNPNRVSIGSDLLNSDFMIPLQFYIYNRRFLIENNILFYENIFHEDFEFTPRVLYYAKKVSFYNKPIYNHLKRKGSITSEYNPKKSFDLLLIANVLISFKENVAINKKMQYNNLISLAINNSLYNIRYMNNDNVHMLFQELRKNNKLFNSMCHSRKFKYIIEGILFKLFPVYSFYIYKMYHK